MLKQIWNWVKSLFAPKTLPFTSQHAASFFRNKAVATKMLRKTAGGRHAWYEMSDGSVCRKPIK